MSEVQLICEVVSDLALVEDQKLLQSLGLATFSNSSSSESESETEGRVLEQSLGDNRLEGIFMSTDDLESCLHQLNLRSFSISVIDYSDDLFVDDVEEDGDESKWGLMRLAHRLGD